MPEPTMTADQISDGRVATPGRDASSQMTPSHPRPSQTASSQTVPPGPSPLRIDELSTPPGWYAFVIDLPAPPLTGDDLDVLRALVDGLRLIAVRRWNLTANVFLQIAKINVDGNPAIYEENITRWQPSIGLGVWPHRQPPRRMTQDDAMDHAAALMTGDEPEMNSHHLAHITSGREAAEHAEASLLGRGMILTMYAADPFSSLVRAGTEAFLPTVLDRAYRSAAFYMPLLDAATISVSTADQLEHWLCGATLYLRESAEDQGLLIVSSKPLRPILERARDMMAEAAAARTRIGSPQPLPASS